MLTIRSLTVSLAAAALVALTAFPIFAQDAAKTPPAAPVANAADAPLPEEALGEPNAPVTIVEYSSLACPHCAAYHKEVLPKLKAEYIDKGKVRYVVHEFPHNQAALAAAVVARCLDPSRYFPFIELLFSRQADWAFKDDALAPLKQFAKQAGLPEEQFNKCLDDESLQKKIIAVRNEGAKKGVNGVPTIFVNGKAVKNPTFENIAEAIKPYLGS